MTTLTLALALAAALANPTAPEKPDTRDAQLLFDFTSTGDTAWRATNDGVMGGLSSGAMSVKDGIGRFAGVVSLENNGGFSSVRSRPADHDLSGKPGLLLRMRGDGKTYMFTLRTGNGRGGVSYRQSFTTTAGVWQEVWLALDDFKPYWRGRLLPLGPVDPAEVSSLGFMIAGKQAGPFALEVDWIKAGAQP